MSGRPYIVNPASMMEGARAASALGKLASQLGAEVGGIQVPPGVEGAPQSKLGVVSRRLAQVGRAVSSEAPYIQNAARWAAIFDAPSGPVHPMHYFGFPGPTPGLATPFANTDATDHPGPDWLSGIVSPVREIAKGLPGAALLVACPPAWVIKNQESIRWGVANTGKLGREAWRDAYASDAGDAGDRDYAWGQRALTLLTLPFFYARAANAGPAAVKAAGRAAAARTKEASRQHTLDGLKGTRPGARWSIGRGADGKPIYTDLKKQHSDAIKEAERALAKATRARAAREAMHGWSEIQRVRLPIAAAGATGAAAATPVTADNVESARERERDGR